jgi:threonine synthase
MPGRKFRERSVEALKRPTGHQHYVSTRREAPAVTASAAILAGLAPDGGLYVPADMPAIPPAGLPVDQGLADTAAAALAPFFAGDPLAEAIPGIVAEALDFELPLVDAGPFRVLELFHGPTAAFKDVGARFLACALHRLGVERTVLVATSGDTGGAVAAAFHGRPRFRVVLLYPNARVSPRQEAQLSCWGGNVLSLRVAGDFDDCQRMVKATFADPALRERARLSSANSISIGRLLPQSAYYAWAAVKLWRETGVAPGFVIPSGNLGNSLACLWARRCGLPVGPVVLATNANEPVGRFFAGEPWQPRPTVQTLATAMDVGNPSNMERLLDLAGSEAAARREASALCVSDEAIRSAIRRGPERYGRTWCPHTATAVHAWEALPAAERQRPWVIVATAHPAKFPEIVEPLVGRPVAVPPALAALLDQPRQVLDIGPDPAALRELLVGMA